MFIDYPVPSCLIRGSYKFVTNEKILDTSHERSEISLVKPWLR